MPVKWMDLFMINSIFFRIQILFWNLMKIRAFNAQLFFKVGQNQMPFWVVNILYVVHRNKAVPYNAATLNARYYGKVVAGTMLSDSAVMSYLTMLQCIQVFSTLT